MSKHPIEVSVSYGTFVETIAEAWAFVMEHVDHVGDEPTVEIHPQWLFPEDDQDSPIDGFSVAVSGSVEVKGSQGDG